MNKKERQDIKQKKYIKRLKLIYWKNKELVRKLEKNPKFKEKGITYNFTAYKNHSTPCSCYGCRYHYKAYNRAKKKFEDRDIINNE